MPAPAFLKKIPFLGKEKDESKPSKLAELRAKHPPLDHAVAAGERYKEKHGDYFGAGITYFSIFALFPLAMIVFAGAGYVLASQPERLEDVKDWIADNVDGSLGEQITDLVDNAIDSRATVGLIGLVGALWSGLGWIAQLRAALTEMWDSEIPKTNFLVTKAHDLGAMLGLFVALVLTLGLSALSGSGLADKVLEWIGLDDAPGAGLGLRALSIAVAIGADTILFTFIIAKLPRVAFPLIKGWSAGLLCAVIFEVFKLVAVTVIMKAVSGPAGATFGPVLGVMLFIYLTSRIVLLCAAWAATDPKNLKYVIPAVPDPVIISPTVVVNDAAAPAKAAAFVGAGVIGGALLGRVLRRR